MFKLAVIDDAMVQTETSVASTPQIRIQEDSRMQFLFSFVWNG